MSRIIAIGDIHGCSKTFKKLLSKIDLKLSDKIYCLGDLIDRGPDSKGVADLIIKLRRQGYNIHILRGNHESLMFDSIYGKKQFNIWMNNGGDSTLKSFKINTYSELKTQYQLFFRRTKYFIVKGNVLFSHAGFNLTDGDIFKDKYSMLWSRNCSVGAINLGGRTIVHGHTPKDLRLILSSLGQQVINIDAGCVFKDQNGYGNLVAFNITDRQFLTQKNIDL